MTMWGFLFFFFFSCLIMNFSPYSPSPDEDRSTRVKKQKQPLPGFSSYQSGNPESFAEQGVLGVGSSSSNVVDGNGISSSSTSNININSVRVNKYETTVPIRVDIEAAFCYLFGPITGKTIGKSKVALFIFAYRIDIFNTGNTKWLCSFSCLAGKKRKEKKRKRE